MDILKQGDYVFMLDDLVLGTDVSDFTQSNTIVTINDSSFNANNEEVVIL